MQKQISKVPSGRLQRMKLKLWKYKINLVYLPGKYMYVADFLSRCFKNDATQSSTVADIDGLIHSINVSPNRENQIREETTEIQFYVA